MQKADCAVGLLRSSEWLDYLPVFEYTGVLNTTLKTLRLILGGDYMITYTA